MSSPHSGRAVAVCFAATIFVSAFLLFQVQPLVSKTILPWFGGTPAVWTTCMLFFQVLLFAGYAYAHAVSALLRPRWQGAMHLLLIVAALALLPLVPSNAWKPAPGGEPTLQILVLLCLRVGLPYFLLAATGPLLQAWFARQLPGRSPYRLYALSNVGSLLALLTYPFLVEPQFTVTMQGRLWSLGFCLFAVGCGYVASRLLGWRSEAGLVQSSGDSLLEDEDRDRWQLAWLLLPALASVMLLATTKHVCQDVAVIPFLWIVPLALYLLTFIICFDNERWYDRRAFSVAAIAAVLIASISGQLGARPSILLEAAAYFAALFFVSMVCHGELVRRRPSPRGLTAFYLMCSAGGALGGVLVAIVCPLVFSDHLEMNLSLIVGYVVSMFALGSAVADRRENESRPTAQRRVRPLQVLTAVAVFGGLLVVVAVQSRDLKRSTTASVRNFYGVLHVVEASGGPSDRRARVLYHGRIAHGLQFLGDERRRQPTMYYAQETGVGQALAEYGRRGPVRVGIIGVGAGTLATYGRPNDYLRMYEINPAVVELARRHFSFLSDCRAKSDVILGDARLQLESEPPQRFDVLVVDAFSGDAVPAHLLTREAMDVYRRHLAPGGTLAVHISNRHLNLRPVVAGLAEYAGMECVVVENKEDIERGVWDSDWALVTRDPQMLARAEALKPAEQVPLVRRLLWTDKYNNLFEILK